MASFTTFVITMYSASILENAIANYKVDFQLIALPNSIKIYLFRDILFIKISSIIRLNITNNIATSVRTPTIYQVNIRSTSKISKYPF